jgi:hypothetical protein
MTTYARVRLEGSVPVALGPADAFALFTPSGERKWAAGWDPWFPAPVEDETEPGTVFQTSQHHTTTWIVVACDPHRAITYSNVSDEGRAGMIHVRCDPDPDGTTVATVTYDITPLNERGARWLSEFAAGYLQYLEHWQKAIRAALASP